MDLFETALELTDQVEPEREPEPEPERYLGLSPPEWLERVALVARPEWKGEGCPVSIALTPRIEAVHEDVRVQLRATDSSKLLITLLRRGDQTMGFNDTINQCQYWVTHATLRMTGSEFSRFRELVDQAQARAAGRLL